MKLFRKQKTFRQIEGAKADPAAVQNPTTVEDYRRRGWAYHARRQYAEAEADFRRALEMAPQDPDLLYALGLCLKRQGRAEEAVQAFQQVLQQIEREPATDVEARVRQGMLRRLTLGHINELTKGDWDLEKEVWQRV